MDFGDIDGGEVLMREMYLGTKKLKYTIQGKHVVTVDFEAKTLEGPDDIVTLIRSENERLRGNKDIIPDSDDYIGLPPGDIWNIRSLHSLMYHLFYKKGYTCEVLEHYPPILLEDGDEFYF